MSRLARSVVCACMGWLLLPVGLPVAEAATTAQMDAARNKALAWMLQTQNGDGSWRNAAGTEVLATTAALDALSKAGVKAGFHEKPLSPRTAAGFSLGCVIQANFVIVTR